MGLVILVSGCNSSASGNSFDWELSDSTLRADLASSGISPDRQQSSFAPVEIRISLPDGNVFDVQAARMWINFDVTENDTGDPANDRLESLRFHTLTEGPDVVTELEKLAVSIGYELDAAYVQKWVDNHVRDDDPRLGIRVTGWPTDQDYVLSLGIKDRGSDRYRVSLTIWWPSDAARELVGDEEQPLYE